MAVAGGDPCADDNRTRQPWKHAFALLAAAELGRGPDYSGPSAEDGLRSRVALLALLFDIIPRAEMHHLDAVVDEWLRRRPSPAPISLSELRSTAREVVKRQPGGPDQATAGEAHVERAAAIAKLPAAMVAELQGSRATASDGADPETRRLLALGLRSWFDALDANERWTHLPAVVPGQSAVPIDKVYVELFAVAEQDAGESAEQWLDATKRLSRRLLASQCPVVSAAAMASRTLERCIVLGEPGSGKSTLVQWIARAANRGRLSDFDAALVVKLSAFAAAAAGRPQLSLLEFFFESLGLEVADWGRPADWLRRVAGESRRCLLLLDGWDEVPLRQRDAVRQCIRQDARHFVTVVTSRPAGQPAQLWGAHAADVYHMAGLAPRAIDELVRNLLASLHCPELAESILRRVAEEPDLKEMASNPFLLGLLVRVLIRTAGTAWAPQTFADIYGQVISWVQECHDQSAGRRAQLTAEHIAGMERLSHGLLFESSWPRYLFRRRELAESLGRRSTEPVLRSRFVNRIDPVFDEYAFLHATFQEYLAARQATNLRGAELDSLLDRAFRSASRFIVLEFVAGLGEGASQRCQERVLGWLQTPDRFQQVLLRVARLAAAGKWRADDPGGLGRALRDELWREIEINDDMESTQAAVEALARLDPRDLCRRARRAHEVSTWALNCMVESLPPSVAREERLDELISPEWRDYAGFDLRGGATAQEIEKIRTSLADASADAADRLEAVRHAGAARDSGAVPMLSAIAASTAEDQEVRQQAIDSLAAVGGRVAIDGLIDLIFRQDQTQVDCIQMAAATLRNVDASRGALDPAGRDRLLRRLAVLAPDDWRIEHLLTALEGHPIRDGAAVIGELALSRELRPEVRAKAVSVLVTVADRGLSLRVLESIESEPSGHVASMMLNLAVARSLRMPPKWLQQRIKECRDRVRLHQLVKAYVLLLPHILPAERGDAVHFLHRLIVRAMGDDSDRSGDLGKALTAALSLAPGAEQAFLLEETLELARDTLANFAERPGDALEAQVLLAIGIAAYFRRESARVEIRKALDAVLARAPGTEFSRNALDRMGLALAGSLAEIAPGELLNYSSDVEPVQAALRRMATRRGWMVFGNRITDAEGVEIAVRGVAPKAAAVVRDLPEMKDILEALPPEMKRALQAYLAMVREGGPCATGEALPAIYHAMKQRMDGEIADQAADYLDSLFRNGFPGLANWRKTLNRIEARFRGKPEMTLLRRVGLYRRSNLRPR